MKRYYVILLVLAILGCTQHKPKANDKIIVKVNNYEISLKEFQEDFKASSFGRVDTLDSRKEFLDNLINRKIILYEAHKQNLDKEEGFLKMIEKFWEQSLLKLALERKIKDIANSTQVSDKMIEDAYNKLLKDNQADQPYDQMYQKIKWDITKLKEAQVLNEWIVKLRKQSNLKINYDLLEKE